MKATNQNYIPGFEDFSEKFQKIINSFNWTKAQEDFNLAKNILTVGNGGNLAVCDHGAIDIARLTNKNSSAPGSGILASSLINDMLLTIYGFEIDLSISMRSMTPENKGNNVNWSILIWLLKKYLSCFEFAIKNNLKTLLISAQEPKLKGEYNTVVLDVNEYHTSEVLTLFFLSTNSWRRICMPFNQSIIREGVQIIVETNTS